MSSRTIVVAALVVLFALPGVVCSPVQAVNLIEMSDKLDRIDADEFTGHLSTARQAASRYDFATAEESLVAARKLAFQGEDHKKLEQTARFVAQCRQEYADEQERLAEERRREEEYQERLARLEEQQRAEEERERQRAEEERRQQERDAQESAERENGRQQLWGAINQGLAVFEQSLNETVANRRREIEAAASYEREREAARERQRVEVAERNREYLRQQTARQQDYQNQRSELAAQRQELERQRQEAARLTAERQRQRLATADSPVASFATASAARNGGSADDESIELQTLKRKVRELEASGTPVPDALKDLITAQEEEESRLGRSAGFSSPAGKKVDDMTCLDDVSGTYHSSSGDQVLTLNAGGNGHLHQESVAGEDYTFDVDFNWGTEAKRITMTYTSNGIYVNKRTGQPADFQKRPRSGSTSCAYYGGSIEIGSVMCYR